MAHFYSLLLMHIEVRPGWKDRQSEDINSRTSALIFRSILRLAAQLLVVFSLVHVDAKLQLRKLSFGCWHQPSPVSVTGKKKSILVSSRNTLTVFCDVSLLKITIACY
ncbi:unnamed protein product [Clavelina lepadiformis]|uniref:Uncharacterized protein n=1 Tax=Clavelina lepadiformis TaxID=159417 RepID=A0ABP0F972_CLALP